VTEPTTVAATPRDEPPPTPPRPEPSPRTGVLVNVDSVAGAFESGTASQSVGYVQHVLRTRGVEPGDPTGIATRQTRAALAQFQASIGETPTGVPTAVTLDYLGFDVT
jgi:peptidoglycan hydrolase-like protein with peptidoglycan-binding domain